MKAVRADAHSEADKEHHGPAVPVQLELLAAEPVTVDLRVLRQILDRLDLRSLPYGAEFVSILKCHQSPDTKETPLQELRGPNGR